MDSVASSRFEYGPPPTRFLARSPTREVEIAGLPGDHVFESIKNTGIFYEIELLERLARRAGPFTGFAIDVGSNIGNHAIYFASFLNVRVLCLEPSPRALRLLRRNLAANGLERAVAVYEAAAGDREGLVTVCDAPPTQIGSTRVREHVATDTEPAVRMVRLDDIAADVHAGGHRVSLVKIDVEGFEERVLAGAERLLQQDRPTLVLELANTEARDRVSASLKRLAYQRFGPWCWTPTYIFATTPIAGPLDELRYRLWRAFTRGRLRRFSRFVLGQQRTPTIS